MKEQKEEIKKFAIDFFNRLGCRTKIENESLVVEGVPSDFEVFYGKKSPYKIIFDKESENENSELAVKGSFLIKSMANYLENRGQTTLLKIDFKIDPNEIIRKNINLGDSILSSINKKIRYSVVVRFSFLSVFQYLNEKKQILNSICVDEKGKIDFNPEDFKMIEGSSSEFNISDINLYYLNSKKELKNITDKKTNEIKNYLGDKIKKEVERIENHYKNQKEELNKSADRLKSQIKEIEEKSKNIEGGIDELKIKKLKDNLNSLNIEEKISKIEQEEKFFINDEIFKHSLNINNKLINTSLIYYPTYIFDIILKNKEGSARQITIDYDPIKDKTEELECELCRKKINEIILCSSGHLICKDCCGICENCRRKSCFSCLKNLCEKCRKRICKKCLSRCMKCGKQVCIEHIRKDFLSKKEECIDCIDKCSECQNYFDRVNIKKCKSCERDVCNMCFAKNIILNKGRNLCVKCSIIEEKNN